MALSLEEMPGLLQVEVLQTVLVAQPLWRVWRQAELQALQVLLAMGTLLWLR